MWRNAFSLLLLSPTLLFGATNSFDFLRANSNLTVRGSLTLGGETRTNWPSGGSGAVTITTAGRLGGGAVATNAFALTFDETGLLTNVPPLDYSILTNAPWVTASVTNGLLTAVPEGIGYLASNQTWTGNQTISNFLAIGTTPATALYIQSNGIRTDAHGASAWGVDVIGAQLFGGPWVDDSGYKFLTAATGVTNNGYTIISGITTSLVANGGSVTIGSTSTNGLATTSYVNGITNGLYLASNPSGYVTAIVTNGLASTVYVNSQGFVTQSVTNGLISSVTGPGLTTAAGGAVTFSTNGWTMSGGSALTNGQTGVTLTGKFSASNTQDVLFTSFSMTGNTTNDLAGEAYDFNPTQASASVPWVDAYSLYNAATNVYTMIVTARWRVPITGATNLSVAMMRTAGWSTNANFQVGYTNNLTGAAWFSGNIVTNTVPTSGAWANYNMAFPVLTNAVAGQLWQLIGTVVISATNGATAPASWNLQYQGQQW